MTKDKNRLLIIGLIICIFFVMINLLKFTSSQLVISRNIQIAQAKKIDRKYRKYQEKGYITIGQVKKLLKRGNKIGYQKLAAKLNNTMTVNNDTGQWYLINVRFSDHRLMYSARPLYDGKRMLISRHWVEHYSNRCERGTKGKAAVKPIKDKNKDGT